MNESARPPQAQRRWRAIGTSVVVATLRSEHLDQAATIVSAELDALDRSCSRFRPDSEIAGLERARGEWVGVSPLLFEALTTAVEVAEQTGGAVDPTVGPALAALGYDGDFATVDLDGPVLERAPLPAEGWWSIELDRRRQAARVPAGLVLDLGSSAKAFAADRSAALVHSATGDGVLVSLGGDVAVAGPPPPDGWPVGIAAQADAALSELQQVVTLSSGALASSSTVARSWRRGRRVLHHIVDPFTGDCAGDHWQLVSVAASSCVGANAASTAAIVWGEEAVGRFEAARLTARLVARDGSVTTTGGWPSSATRPSPAQGARHARWHPAYGDAEGA